MVTILVAGHRPQARDLIVDVLSGSGHRIIVSSNGEEALRLAKSNKLDLIVTDILMPSIGGYEFVSLLRSDPQTADMQILFSAADYLRSEAQSLAEACGVPWILLKETDRTAILPAVNLALARKSNRIATTAGRAAAAVSAPEAKRSTAPSRQEIAELTCQMSPDLNPERLVQRFLDGARRLMLAEVAVVSINQEPTSENYFNLMSSSQELTDVHLAAELANTLKRLAARESSLKTGRTTNGEDSPKSLISAAVRSGDRHLGWLCFHNSSADAAFTTEHCRAASALGVHLGSAYSASLKFQESSARSAELEKRIEQGAQKDDNSINGARR
jgi:CheY-like chemotaxis protein